MKKIDMKVMADLMTATIHHQGLINYLLQLESGNEKLVELNNLATHIPHWFDIDVHIVNQGWSNTSCGWESIGGSAITHDYTIVIENKRLLVSFVYYNGKLAYICKIDSKYESIGCSSLPGYNSASKELDIIYKHKRK